MTIPVPVLAGVGTGQANTRREIVEVHEHFDQPGTAEVVEVQHPASERGPPVGRSVPTAKRTRSDAATSAQRVATSPVSGCRLGRRHLLDPLVDRRVDRGVEVGHRREQGAVGRAAGSVRSR